MASAIPITLAAGRGHANLGPVLLAVGLLSVLFLLLSFALVVRQRSLTAFLTVAPLPLVPLIAVPLAHLTGLDEHPAVLLVPTTGAADLIRVGVDPATVMPSGRTAAELGYLALAVAAGTLAARQRFAGEFIRPSRVRPPRERRHTTSRQPSGWLAALLHIDARTSVRSALLILVLPGPILLAVALRLGYPPLASYLHTRLGFDLTLYQPILLASLVVLHVPLIIGMVGALLIVDDIDDRKVLLLRVSPVTLSRYLAYRAISVAAVAMVTLAVAVPVCGLAPWRTIPTLLPALVLAAAQAPLITLATAAFAANKVEGLAWLKILGLLPTGIAPAIWWLPDPTQWPLRVLPHYWTVDILWHPTLPGVVIGVGAHRAHRRTAGPADSAPAQRRLKDGISWRGGHGRGVRRRLNCSRPRRDHLAPLLLPVRHQQTHPVSPDPRGAGAPDGVADRQGPRLGLGAPGLLASARRQPTA